MGALTSLNGMYGEYILRLRSAIDRARGSYISTGIVRDNVGARWLYRSILAVYCLSLPKTSYMLILLTLVALGR